MPENTITLGLNEPFSVHIGKIPQGRYAYHFTVLNPATNPGVLKVFTKNDLAENARIFKVLGSALELEYNFSTSGKEQSDIVFLLEKGSGLTLKLPVSATMVQEINEYASILLGLDEKIISKIGELDSGNASIPGSGTNKRERTYAGGQPSKTASFRDVELFISARYFRGMLSLEESERQLDHVVFNKLFAPDGSGGFIKLKRKIYRKIIVRIYRLFTKNRSRKLYFAKLYRNYVNSNTLSENYHNH